MENDEAPGADSRPPSAELSGLGEDGLIKRIREAAGFDHPRLIRAIGDDAAVVAASEKSLLTTDLLIEGVHFQLELTPPRLLGRKALAVNLSDIAAMAGIPRFALLGLAAPAGFSTAVLDQILDGFLSRARETEVALIGGDVSRADKLIFSVCVIGDAPLPGPVYRFGASPDDLLFVTGELGDSALGLLRLGELPPPITEDLINRDPLAGPIMKHLDPVIRLNEGLKLAGKASAMMDLSDGVVTDLTRLLLESGVPGAMIEADAVPLSPAFSDHFKIRGRAEGEAREMALAGGEDYELLFTAPPRVEPELAKLIAAGLKITRIGRLSSEPGLKLLDPEGKELALPAPLFEHFFERERTGKGASR